MYDPCCGLLHKTEITGLQLDGHPISKVDLGNKDVLSIIGIDWIRWKYKITKRHRIRSDVQTLGICVNILYINVIFWCFILVRKIVNCSEMTIKARD